MVAKKGLTWGGQRFLKASTIAAMEKNRCKDRVCYLGNIGVFRDGSDEYGMGGAACTYWNIDRKDDTFTVWFTQHLDMPEFTDIKAVDPKKADMWALLHSAIDKCKSNAPKQRKRSGSGSISSAGKRHKSAS